MTLARTRRDSTTDATRRLAVALAVLVALGGTIAGCRAAASAQPGACADVRAPGAKPALESLLPASLADAAPTTVDSGVNCSATALATLRTHGVAELDFAGATWDDGNGTATSIAVLARPAGSSLDVGWVEEFYEAGARSGKKTDNISVTRPSFPDVGAVYRLDVLNDLSFQSVVVWADGPVSRVVIVASPVNPGASRAEHDARVATAVADAARAPDS